MLVLYRLIVGFNNAFYKSEGSICLTSDIIDVFIPV